jgi:hypothetical protein
MLLEIGIAGLGLLASISVIFGLVAQLVIGQRNHWTWLVGAVAWFVGGLFASEVIWGPSRSTKSSQSSMAWPSMNRSWAE